MNTDEKRQSAESDCLFPVLKPNTPGLFVRKGTDYRKAEKMTSVRGSFERRRKISSAVSLRCLQSN